MYESYLVVDFDFGVTFFGFVTGVFSFSISWKKKFQTLEQNYEKIDFFSNCQKLERVAHHKNLLRAKSWNRKFHPSIQVHQNDHVVVSDILNKILWLQTFQSFSFLSWSSFKLDFDWSTWILTNSQKPIRSILVGAASPFFRSTSP